jgi:hypothetical protein
LDALDPVQEEVRTAVSKARVLRARGDLAGADVLLAELLERHPDHPGAMEAKAEALVEAGKTVEARDLLAEVVAKHPGRIATERRHAELVLKIAEAEMLKQALLSGMDPSLIGTPAGMKRRAGTAAFFNMLLPGFGQIYNGELTKGLILAGFTVLSWIAMFALALERVPDGFRRDGSQKFATHTTGFFWPVLVSLLTVYIVSILEASATAAKAPPLPKPERPVPPVDKPFE